MQKYKVYINNTPKIITEKWKSFCSDYKLIIAAGGVVYNKKNQLLMIFRNEKWDLPKGKLEEGEDIKVCALREVEEECGVKGLKIVNKISETYHVYKVNHEKILKRTYWFKMSTDFNNKLIPQISEGITKVEWVDNKDIKQRIADSYRNIKEIFTNE